MLWYNAIIHKRILRKTILSLVLGLILIPSTVRSITTPGQPEPINSLGKGDVPTEQIKVVEPVQSNIKIPTSTGSLDQWISNLSSCESGGDWKAVNEIDLDGTSSLGRFQFKTGTWKAYLKKYNLPSDWSLWDGNKQEIVVRFMVIDPSVRWTREFPDCVRKYGFPPGNTSGH